MDSGTARGSAPSPVDGKTLLFFLLFHSRFAAIYGACHKGVIYILAAVDSATQLGRGLDRRGMNRLRRVRPQPGQAAWTRCLRYSYCYGPVYSGYPFQGAERLWTQRSVSVDSAPFSPWTR